jgi:16S rRNA (guanine(966)-N(2))-methyltransferase RsmD
MRIITGKLKGRKLPFPNGAAVRPTADRVKEGLFSVLESRRSIRNCSVLDLFAGSGNLGFEALSRGAQSVLFVDHNPKCIEYIQNTARKFDMDSQIRTIAMNVSEFLEGAVVPGAIILADPPYKYRTMEKLVKQVLDGSWLEKEGMFILEHNKYREFSRHDRFLLEKKYGRTHVSFFQKSAYA